VIFSFVCITILSGVIYHHNLQVNKIIQQHRDVVEAQTEMIKTVKISKGVVRIDENLLRSVQIENKTIENLLELQANNLHTQYTILSIWAGVLMIVFLVFSLYSMFKTDELIKQARESLITIGNSKVHVDNKILEVDNKINEAVEYIKKESTKSIDEIRKNLHEEQKRVSDEIISKGKDFSNELDKYQRELDSYRSSVESVSKGIKLLLDAINKTGTSSMKEETQNSN
jgi:hypothetical protein